MAPVEVGTIREIQSRLTNEGYRVSTYALRQWIKAGSLTAVYAGNKALISYVSVLNLLKGNTTSPM